MAWDIKELAPGHFRVQGRPGIFVFLYTTAIIGKSLFCIEPKNAERNPQTNSSMQQAESALKDYIARRKPPRK
jgi:hypothetical protein